VFPEVSQCFARYFCCSRAFFDLMLNRNGNLTIGLSVLFNLPIALFFATCFVVFTFWIDIYNRCTEVTQSTTKQTWADILLSKLAM
jgi:phosphotransferase system  glucose/maltose/N-acetylglucosamine-specific IIC component